MLSTRIARLTVAIGLAFPSAAVAQTPRLHESVVVSGAVEPIPFETVGRAIWVLTREDIARLPVQSIDDLLRFASSVDVRARGPRLQADFSIRGASFGQTLVLIDGVRMNDAQSGHHNSDVPLTLDDIERVEVLMGAGSSLFGADAFGGTVNIITRQRDTDTGLRLTTGAHGLAAGRGTVGLGRGDLRQVFSAEAVRSSGFVDDRDFETVSVTSRTSVGSHTRVLFGAVRKDFGASGFYGPAPSRERTDQTVLGIDRGFALAGWRLSAQTLYRTHGDWFLYDPRQPSLVANEHRTHAASLVFRGSRALGGRARVTAGAEAGGDWIRSNNLGRRSFGRGSAFVELQQRIGERLFVYPGIRYDGYSRFGDAWSPSAAARFLVHRTVSVRASTGRAFRVPTFTELYYCDPNHEARSTLTAERGWSAEAGVDWIARSRTLARATLFTRHDRGVIDWIRGSTAERWRTTNVRRVETSGVELGVRHLMEAAGWFDIQYTHLRTHATALAGVLSKYVLDYAPHNTAVSGGVRGPFGVDVSVRFGVTERNDGRVYQVADLRASRTCRRLTVFVDAANLFDERYQEIVGVAMPGRWISAGLRFDLRGRSAKIASGDSRNALSGIVHWPDARGIDAAGRPGAEDR